MNSKSAVTQIQLVSGNGYPYSRIGRQLSTERFARDNIQFCLDEENLECCDYIVVFERVPNWLSWFSITLPKYKTIFVAGEPPHLRRYTEHCLKQFGTIITYDRDMPHPNRLFVQSGLPWLVGLYSRGVFAGNQ